MSIDGNSYRKRVSLGAIPTTSLQRFLPEPKNRLGRAFASVLKSVGSGFVGGQSFGAIDPAYQDLINQQIQIQQQMQLVSLHSNIERSKHETQMAALRNLRVA